MNYAVADQTATLGAFGFADSVYTYTTDGKMNANDVLAAINENARVTNADLEVLPFALRLTCATPTASYQYLYGGSTGATAPRLQVTAAL